MLGITNTIQFVSQLSVLTQRELAIRYRNSAAGWAWVFGAPLLMITVYSLFLLGVVRPSPTDGVPVLSELAAMWFCVGLWHWFSETAARSASVIHDNAQLVKKTPVSLALLPTANVVVAAISFLMPAVLSIGAMVVSGADIKQFVILMVVTLGLVPWVVFAAFFFAVTGTYIRDMKHALPLLLSIGVFLTPILFAPADLPSFMAAIINLNPLTPAFSVIKSSAQGSPIDWTGFAALTLLGVVAAGGSISLFHRRKKDFFDVV